MNEDIDSNNLFFTCSLIEYIARITKNTKKYIVNKLGMEKINKIYNLAEIYHSENIDKIADELIKEHTIINGNYDILSNIKNTNPPTYWDIGKVYKRLIIKLSLNKSEYIDKLIEVLSSWLIFEIDKYDSNLYYENPDYIYECYKEKKIV